MNKNTPCVCDSGRQFGKCCEPFLSGRDKPRTVRQLMRSRYSAYALGGYGEYLQKTWHPADAQAISVADLDAVELDWKGLELVDSAQQGDSGWVEFKARFSEQGGPEQLHHERSAFVRHRGQWYYLSGEVTVLPS